MTKDFGHLKTFRLRPTSSIKGKENPVGIIKIPGLTKILQENQEQKIDVRLDLQVDKPLDRKVSEYKIKLDLTDNLKRI